MKILVCILTTQLHRESRLKYIFETWLKKVKNYLIISDEEDDKKNIVKLSNDSSYESHIEKNFKSFHYLYKNYNNYDWYINLDDDTFLNYTNLEKELKNYSSNDIFMMGHINKGTLPQDPNLNYCSGGAGYVFNKKTLELLKNIESSYNKSRYADANIGMFCRDKEIPLVNNKMFHPREPNFFSYNEKNIKNAITFHYILEDKFYEINNIVNRVEEGEK